MGHHVFDVWTGSEALLKYKKTIKHYYNHIKATFDRGEDIVVMLKKKESPVWLHQMPDTKIVEGLPPDKPTELSGFATDEQTAQYEMKLEKQNPNQ